MKLWWIAETNSRAFALFNLRAFWQKTLMHLTAQLITSLRQRNLTTNWNSRHKKAEKMWIDFLFTCVRRSQQIYFDLVLICWLSDRFDIYGFIVRDFEREREMFFVTGYLSLIATVCQWILWSFLQGVVKCSCHFSCNQNFYRFDLLWAEKIPHLNS